MVDGEQWTRCHPSVVCRRQEEYLVNLLPSILVFRKDVQPQQTKWDSQQWLVSAEKGTTEHMTVGRVTFKPGQSKIRPYQPILMHPYQVNAAVDEFAAIAF